MTDDNSAERIMRIATVLFAEHGFDGVTTREIAAAAGLNIATVSYHVGGKRDLYRAVFRRLSQLEHDVVAQILDDAATTELDSAAQVRSLLRGVAGTLVEMTAEHPHVPRLWVRRWLAEVDDETVDIEASLPIYRMFFDLVDRIGTESGYAYRGPHLDLFMKSVSWILYGHALSGPLDWKTGTASPDDPAHQARLAEFLEDYFANAFGLPPSGVS